MNCEEKELLIKFNQLSEKLDEISAKTNLKLDEIINNFSILNENSNEAEKKLKEELEYLKEKSNKIEFEKESLNETNKKLKEDLEYLKEKSNKIEFEKESLNETNKKLKEDLEYLKEKSKKLEFEKESLNEINKRLKEKIENLKSELFQLSEKKEKLEKELGFFSQEIELKKLLDNHKLLEKLEFKNINSSYSLLINLTMVLLNNNKAQKYLKIISEEIEDLDLFKKIYESIVLNYLNGYELLEIKEGDIFDPEQSISLNGEEINSRINKVYFKGYSYKETLLVKNIVSL